MVDVYIQDNLAVAVRATQLGWIFQKCVTKDMGLKFAGVEKLLQEKNLPCFPSGKLKYLLPIVETFSTMPVKKYGPGLQNPVTSANEKYQNVLPASSKLI